MPVSNQRVPSGVWRDADFRRLWVGVTASQVGEQATAVVLPLFAVLTLHVGPGQLGVLRAVEQAPILLLSLFVGAGVDRWPARTVMVLTDAARALALLATAAAGLFGWLGLPALFAVAFAVGALSVCFDVAYQASLVRLVQREQLVPGNSALEGSRSAALIAGPALGGVLVSLLTASAAAACNALLFVLSFLTIRRIHRIRHGQSPRLSDLQVQGAPLTPDQSTPIWRRIHAGLSFVTRNSILRTVCLASAAFQFSYAATMTAYLLFLPRDLHLSGTAIGLALTATGPGALLGSMLAARLPRRFGYGAVLVTAAALGDSAFLWVPTLHGSAPTTLSVLLVTSFLFGTGAQLVNVTVMAVRQTATPDEMQGRAAATITFAGMGLTPLGSLLGGVLAAQWGVRTSLLVTAAGMLLSPLLIAASPLARLGRELPKQSGLAPPLC